MRRQNNFIYLHSENECIMELFKGQSLLEFTERFKTDLDCEEYLDKHISKTAQVTTDEWKGYKPIKDYNITQKPSNNGKNFPTLHKVIHQVKSWIRGIYSWVSEFNIDRYLAEYSFRINRSQNKDTIFNKLMKRVVEHSPVFQS